MGNEYDNMFSFEYAGKTNEVLEVTYFTSYETNISLWFVVLWFFVVNLNYSMYTSRS